MEAVKVNGKDQKRMESTFQIFFTVDPHHKVKEEMEIVEAGSKIMEKIESVSSWVKTEVDASEDDALLAIKAEEIDVKEEVVETDVSNYKELLNCNAFEVKEKLVDFTNAEEDKEAGDVDGKEDEEASSDDEQIDARLLYPRRGAEETSDEDDELVEEKFEEAMVKSVEIMEASCFGQMEGEEEEWKDGKDRRLSCKTCSRQFPSRRWLAR